MATTATASTPNGTPTPTPSAILWLLEDCGRAEDLAFEVALGIKIVPELVADVEEEDA